MSTHQASRRERRRGRTKIGDLGSASAASPPLGSWCRHPLSLAQLLHALLSYDKLGVVLDDHVMHPRLSTRFEVSAPIDGADCWFERADDLRYVHRPEERSSINHAVAVSAQTAERPSITRQMIVDFPNMALVASIGASTRCLRCARDMLGLTPEALAQSASHHVQSLIQAPELFEPACFVRV